MDVSPVCSEYVPCGHTITSPDDGQALPAGHGRQAVMSLDWIWPAEQAMHCVAPALGVTL